MDDADAADVEQERLLRDAIAAAQCEHLKPMGFCHNCGQLVGAELKFCDKDCLDDWELRQNAKSRSGSRYL